uniref:Galactosylgalactosylxylosylprotein 3-beta-glucuronosyltransferase n=1 Tax=Cacopsylla melanoneura TaxID=428564 RepID=A0A8D8ZZR6_9HEMI
MSPNPSVKIKYHSLAPVGDSSMKKKKKVLFLIVILVVLIWILGIFSRSSGNDLELGEDSIRAMLIQTQDELRISRQQMLHYEQILTSSCLDQVNAYYGSDQVPTIYVITPTYARPVQKAELTRLSHTFMLVPKLHWIIVEDASNKTELVANLLKESNINHTHLHALTPDQYKLKKKDAHWKKPRGVQQRNAALDWLRLFRSSDTDKGIVYFADDDNSYSLKLFSEMRRVKRVGVWPVGLVGGLKVEKPLVNAQGKVIGFNSMWTPQRPFPIDMAGFAINLDLINRNDNVKFSFDVERGYQESAILSKVVSVLSEVEPLADNCTKVYVWHTRTTDPTFPNEILLKKKHKTASDHGMEV